MNVTGDWLHMIYLISLTIGNESVPKIIINVNNNFFINLTAISIFVISNHNSFRVLFDKIASLYFIWKNIYVLALETASPWNRHCANCIGTLAY